MDIYRVESVHGKGKMMVKVSQVSKTQQLKIAVYDCPGTLPYCN